MKFILKQSGSQNYRFIFNINSLGAKALATPEAQERRERFKEKQVAVRGKLQILQPVLEQAVSGKNTSKAHENSVRALLKNYYPDKIIARKGSLNNRMIRLYQQATGITLISSSQNKPANRNTAPAKAANPVNKKAPAVKGVQGRSGAEVRELMHNLGSLVEDFEAGKLNKAEVADLQVALNESNFNSGKVDGIAGRNTRRAVAEYKKFTGKNSAPTAKPKQSNTPEKGEERITLSNLKTKVNSAVERLAGGEKLGHTEIKNLQRCLFSLAKHTGNNSLNPKGVDGVIGDNSQKAIEAYIKVYQSGARITKMPWIIGSYR